MNVDAALQRLQAAEVQTLPLASLKTDAIYQPREARMVPGKDQAKVESRSEEHTGALRHVLEAAHSIELEPVLVANVDGVLCVVDGHHRLHAYRLAKRETIQARVVPMTKLGAVLVSKLVNCSSRALEMHPEQRKDAAWQYLAAVTRGGAIGLPEGESCRTVGARFGVSHETVRTMLRKLPEVNPKDWKGTTVDTGTGWPRWKHFKAWRRDDVEGLTWDTVRLRDVERGIRKLGALKDSFHPETWAQIRRQLLAEEEQEATDIEDMAEDSDF